MSDLHKPPKNERTMSQSAAALTESYGVFQRAALKHKPSYRVQGALTDGFDSTTRSLRTLFPGARLGYACVMPSTSAEQIDRSVGTGAYGLAPSSSIPCSTLSPAKKLTGGGAWPTATPLCRSHRDRCGQEHGERVRHWFQDKKAGWYAVNGVVAWSSRVLLAGILASATPHTSPPSCPGTSGDALTVLLSHSVAM